MNKKIALSLAMIAASGAYALKEAAGRADWLDHASPLAIASGDGSGAPRPTPSVDVAALPPPAPAVVVDPAAVAPLASLQRGRGEGAARARRFDDEEEGEREARGRTERNPLVPGFAPPVPGAPPTWPETAAAAAVSPVTPTSASAAPLPTAKTPGAAFRDGTFTGSSADAYWGNVQVRAVVTGGKLVSVDVLAYPADRRTSQQINRYALPLLQQEVVKAQSANVNIVSGATLTARAYLSSLRSALQQAQ